MLRFSNCIGLKLSAEFYDRYWFGCSSCSCDVHFLCVCCGAQGCAVEKMPAIDPAFFIVQAAEFSLLTILLALKIGILCRERRSSTEPSKLDFLVRRAGVIIVLLLLIRNVTSVLCFVLIAHVQFLRRSILVACITTSRPPCQTVCWPTPLCMSCL